MLKIPNSALRFFPQPQHVRTEDKPLLEGRQDPQKEEEQSPETGLAANERADARRKRSKRHVWVQDGFKLRAVPIADRNFRQPLYRNDLRRAQSGR